MNLVPIILSGGSGTRLWPLSREKYPKQLLKLFNDNSMLQETALRLLDLNINGVNILDPIIVSNSEYRFLIANQLVDIGIKPNVILEPYGRNTAPAVTVSAIQLLKQYEDVVLLVMPSDHLVKDVATFHKAIEKAFNQALDNSVICFGIKPIRAETGFGYIKTANCSSEIRKIISFVEKPKIQIAKSYVESGDYVWNSGIFMFKASTWVNAISVLDKAIFESCQNSLDNGVKDKDFLWLDDESFLNCPSNSIDYVVMEKIGESTELDTDAYVVSLECGWSDVGSWDAVWEASLKDENGNVGKSKSDIFFNGSSNNIVFSDNKRVISLLGLDNLVVVDTQDALLVAHKENLTELKSLVSEVKERHSHLAQVGRKVYRPWGSYDAIDYDDGFQVKRIVVNPGETLSLQMHYHRAEHWIVVKGTGKVTRDNEIILLHENQSVYIPIGSIHRLENPGKLPLELIEVQSGNYLGEDDIVRIDDAYGRVGEK